MSDNEGFEHGEVCNRNGCKGIIIHERDGSCYCHINPPCGYCTDDSAYCPECNWDNKDRSPVVNCAPLVLPKPQPIVDDGKLYEIRRYFDSIYEGSSGSNLTKPEAHELYNKLMNRERYYVSYSIVEQLHPNPERK